MSTERLVADGIIFYSDGGAQPNPGYAGYGVHGYFYVNEVPKQGTGLRGWEMTNAGYVDKLDKLEKITPLHYIDTWSALPHPNTNNVAELAGAIECLQVALEHDIKVVNIITDSEYVRKGMTEWITGWVKRNWVKSTGEPVPNKVWWVQLLELEQQVKAKGIEVIWGWIKGHDGHLGNELSDQLATMGRIAATFDTAARGTDLVPAKGYWSKVSSNNPMLSQTSWYFNTHVGGAQQAKDGRTIYHLSDDATDAHRGKRVGDTASSVLFLKEPDPVLEMVRLAQDAVDDSTFNWVIVGKLDNILSSQTYGPLKKFGHYRIHRRGHKLDLSDVKKTAITEMQNPPGLAFRAVESLTTLSNILQEYLDGNDAYHVTDITSQLYDADVKKKKIVKKLKPTITTSTRVLLINEALHRVGNEPETVPVKLTVGIDIAKRNTLSALAASDPTVKLITWKESGVAFRFATIIETHDDVGIWAGVHSNIHLLIK